MIVRACAAAMLLVSAAVADDLPHSRATLERILDAAGDPILAAQKRLFPEHYAQHIDLFLTHERTGPTEQTRLETLELSHRHWEHYNLLVRQGFPLEWRGLLVLRRDIFALMEEHQDPNACRAYEYHGISAITGSDKNAYRDAAANFLVAFLEAAYAAADNPQTHREETERDFAALNHALAETGHVPQPPSARLTGDDADPAFCRNMMAVLDRVLAEKQENAALLWRYLVTAPPAQ